MNIWELLGIEPTEDVSKIKSAYARQAKQYHPEEHPEEFKALQNAYKLAVKLAKSRRAGVRLTYVPPVQSAEWKSEAERAPEAGRPRAEKALETDQPMAEGALEPEQSEAERASEASRPRAEKALETDQPMAEETSEAGQPGAEEVSETGQQETGAESDVMGEEASHTFDFSGVDAYGDRECFFGQFLLLAKNPYLRNNLEAWDYFLNLDAYAGLFPNTDFRRELVQAICGLHGWRRKTILYFERFLTGFHTEENRPEDGQWETQLRAFRIKKLPRLRLPAFCMDRFLLKEGRNFHRQLRTRVSRSVGREIDLDVKSDLIKYMKLYLSFGETCVAYIDRLHRGWRLEQAMAFALAVAMCFFVIAAGAGSIEQRRKAEAQMSYLQELYGQDFNTGSEEEQKARRREYNTYWKYADDAIDEMLERYEEWGR